MPLYDFHCRACDAHFEELASPDCTGGEHCPSCGSNDTERMLSAHCQIPGSGPNRIPGSLLRGGGARMEKVPMPRKAMPANPAPQHNAGCGSAGGCAGCPGSSKS